MNSYNGYHGFGGNNSGYSGSFSVDIRDQINAKWGMKTVPPGDMVTFRTATATAASATAAGGMSSKGKDQRNIIAGNYIIDPTKIIRREASWQFLHGCKAYQPIAEYYREYCQRINSIEIEERQLARQYPETLSLRILRLFLLDMIGYFSWEGKIFQRKSYRLVNPRKPVFWIYKVSMICLLLIMDALFIYYTVQMVSTISRTRQRIWYSTMMMTCILDSVFIENLTNFWLDYLIPLLSKDLMEKVLTEISHVISKTSFELINPPSSVNPFSSTKLPNNSSFYAASPTSTKKPAASLVTGGEGETTSNQMNTPRKETTEESKNLNTTVSISTAAATSSKVNDVSQGQSDSNANEDATSLTSKNSFLTPIKDIPAINTSFSLPTDTKKSFSMSVSTRFPGESASSRRSLAAASPTAGGSSSKKGFYHPKREEEQMKFQKLDMTNYFFISKQFAKIFPSLLESQIALNYSSIYPQRILVNKIMDYEQLEGPIKWQTGTGGGVGGGQSEEQDGQSKPFQSPGYRWLFYVQRYLFELLTLFFLLPYLVQRTILGLSFTCFVWLLWYLLPIYNVEYNTEYLVDGLILGGLILFFLFFHFYHAYRGSKVHRIRNEDGVRLERVKILERKLTALPNSFPTGISPKNNKVVAAAAAAATAGAIIEENGDDDEDDSEDEKSPNDLNKTAQSAKSNRLAALLSPLTPLSPLSQKSPNSGGPGSFSPFQISMSSRKVQDVPPIPPFEGDDINNKDLHSSFGKKKKMKLIKRYLPYDPTKAERSVRGGDKDQERGHVYECVYVTDSDNEEKETKKETFNGLAKGMYFVQFLGESGGEEVKRVVVE
jgi:hypothetical protein